MDAKGNRMGSSGRGSVGVEERGVEIFGGNWIVGTKEKGMVDAEGRGI